MNVVFLLHVVVVVLCVVVPLLCVRGPLFFLKGLSSSYTVNQDLVCVETQVQKCVFENGRLHVFISRSLLPNHREHSAVCQTTAH